MFTSPDALVSHSGLLAVTSLTDQMLAHRYPKTLGVLSQHLNIPQLEEHIWHFLYDQEKPNLEIFRIDVELKACPYISSTLWVDVYHSATALYHAPSHLSGISSMHYKYIYATPS